MADAPWYEGYGLNADQAEAYEEFLNWGNKARSIGQRRSLADALRGTPQPQGGMAGRVFVGANPLQHAAAAIQQIRGGRQLKAIEGEEAAGLARARVGAGVEPRLKLAMQQREEQAAAAQAQAKAAEELRRRAEDAENVDRRSEARNEATITAARIAAGQKAEEAKVKGVEGGRDRAKEMRQEILTSPVYKDTQTIAASYKKIQNTTDNGPGDLSLLYSYMRMVDPGSTVREGEFAAAAQSGSLPARIQGWAMKVINGERLPPEVRKEFKSEAAKMYEAQIERYKPLSDFYSGMAGRYGIPSQDVVPDFGFEVAPAAGAAPGAAPVADKKAARRALAESMKGRSAAEILAAIKAQGLADD